MVDGLIQTNEIASKSQREMELDSYILRARERDGAKSDGLTQTNEIASKCQRDGAEPDGLTQTIEIGSKHRERQRGDMELFRHIDVELTYRAIP